MLPFKRAKQHRLAIEDQVPVQETFSYKGECCPILLPFQKASSNPHPWAAAGSSREEEVRQ
jgi:hypothetical protein